MSRLAKNHPTTRLNLEMNEAVRRQLEQIRDETHADSLTELIQRALAVYDVLRKATAGGAEIILRTPTTEQQLVISEFTVPAAK